MLSRVAVLGCGSIGYRHLRNLETLGVQQLWLSDPDSASVRTILEKHPGWKEFRWPESLQEIKPDAVVIASPSALHAEHLLQTLPLDLPTFVEKPVTTSEMELAKLRVAAENSSATTMVACNMRFHPGPKEIKRLVDEGAVGRVLSYRLHTGSYLPSWRPHQDYRESYSANRETGGACLDCIHEIDLALWLAGPATLGYAKTISATSLGLETDGLSELILDHSSRILGSIHLNFIERDYRRSQVVIGTEGTVEWNFHRPEVLHYAGGSSDPVRHPLPLNWETNDMYVDEMRHFLTCVAEKRATGHSLKESFASLEIALQARTRF